MFDFSTAGSLAPIGKPRKDRLFVLISSLILPQLLMNLVQHGVPPLAHVPRRYNVLEHDLVPSNCAFLGEGTMVEIQLSCALEQSGKVRARDVFFLVIIRLLDDAVQGIFKGQ